MGRALCLRWWVVVMLAAVAALWAAAGTPSAAAGGTVPLWESTVYRSPGYDRSFKMDLLEQQNMYPRTVVYGGSRSLRMDPVTIKRATGLLSFNLGLHNGKPEDAWALTNYLLERKPERPPYVVWCLQVSNLMDTKVHPGLILDERLSRYFPEELIAAKRDWALRQRTHNLLSGRRYGRYGMLWWNTYDTRFAAGLTLDRALTSYLDADMLATAGNRVLPKDTRAMAYFEATLGALNERGIKPLVVIMPYHPRVLNAFLSVGWDVKIRWLRRYLERIGAEYKFAVADCLRISTFGGSPDGFYDGSHLTAGNSRRLLRYVIAKRPGCFRLHEDWIVPPTGQPPAYKAVKELDAPADLLE